MRLIRGMGLIERTPGMIVVGGTTPLSLVTLRSIGLVELKNGAYTLIQYLAIGEPTYDQMEGIESESEDI